MKKLFRVKEIRLQVVPGVVGRILSIRYDDNTEQMLQLEPDQEVVSQALVTMINSKLSTFEATEE